MTRFGDTSGIIAYKNRPLICCKLLALYKVHTNTYNMLDIGPIGRTLNLFDKYEFLFPPNKNRGKTIYVQCTYIYFVLPLNVPTTYKCIFDEVHSDVWVFFYPFPKCDKYRNVQAQLRSIFPLTYRIPAYTPTIKFPLNCSHSSSTSSSASMRIVVCLNYYYMRDI